MGPKPIVLHLVVLAILLSLLESALILIAFLPPVLSYSPGNLLFALCRIILVIYAGFLARNKGLKQAALDGAAVSSASAFTLCIITILSSLYIHIPVLGIPAPNLPSLLILSLFIILQNALFGAIISAVALWLALKMKK